LKTINDTAGDANTYNVEINSIKETYNSIIDDNSITQINLILP